MQVATAQATRVLAVRRAARRRGLGHGKSRRRRRVAAPPVAAPTLDRVMGRIASLPRVRRDQVLAAGQRVADGACPSADEVAEMLVRRSLCDNLR